MPLDTVPALAQHHDALLTQHLRSFLGDIEPAALALLRDRLTWVEIAGGHTLIEQGAPGDSMYLSISGRLRAYVRDDDGVPRMVREMGRGQVIGEMSLYTDEPRSASVVAIRDSVLVRLDRAHFAELLALSPQVSTALTRQIIQRLQTQNQTAAPHRDRAPAGGVHRHPDDRNPVPLPVTISLLAVSEGIDQRRFADRLAAQLASKGRVIVLDSAAVDAALAELGAANGQTGDAALNRRISLLLDNIEADHEFVLLLGDPTASPWTRRCCRHADELLFLADATKPPLLHAIETDWLAQRPPQAEAAQILVLLHPVDSRCPRDTRAWLARRPVTTHVHIRPELERDMARLARIESRSAVGLVLAGGGARGFAHLGVFKALQEHGVEVDFVGGTSIGAAMAALVAADQPLAATMAITRRAFRINPTGDFNWLPLISLIGGRRLRRVVGQAMTELVGFAPDVEDLWKNYYCVATNYSQAREQVIGSGPLLEAVLASTAIPGALPPAVVDGDLLCDGGTFNNFPVDIMRKLRGVGTVIGIDLNARKPRRMEFDKVPGTWALLRDRLRPRRLRRYKLPTLAAYLMNVTILYSMSRAHRAQAMSDLYFNPPLDRVGLLEWKRYDDIVQQGYAHAVEVLAAQQVSRP
jgi:NTE family protein